jgi:Zn-dependent M28 family amino/carboxypeptidase
VGVLLELARQFSAQAPSVGVDIAFFDAEDWGQKGGGMEAQDSYALGTQYWTRQPHVPGYVAEYGILLDMVGARNAQFRVEGNSNYSAPSVNMKVWDAAARLGYSNYFLKEQGGYVTDDHVYVIRYGIPSIDIIGSDASTGSGFGSHWHTHADDLSVIDPRTLKAVGQTLTEVIYSESR